MPQDTSVGEQKMSTFISIGCPWLILFAQEIFLENFSFTCISGEPLSLLALAFDFDLANQLVVYSIFFFWTLCSCCANTDYDLCVFNYPVDHTDSMTCLLIYLLYTGCQLPAQLDHVRSWSFVLSNNMLFLYFWLWVFYLLSAPCLFCLHLIYYVILSLQQWARFFKWLSFYTVQCF
jgi:hypothetical protein